MCLFGTLRNVNVGKLENLLILIIIQCPISGHRLRRSFFHSTWAHQLSNSPTLWCKWVFIFAFCNLIFLTYCVLTVCVFVCVCSWFFTFVVVSVPAWTLNYMITQWILHFVPKSVLSFQQHGWNTVEWRCCRRESIWGKWRNMCGLILNGPHVSLFFRSCHLETCWVPGNVTCWRFVT